MSVFFIPGSGENCEDAECVYATMHSALEVELGIRPSARRIAKLWARRGSTDCITEVGVADPLHGGVVLAIFDMGHHKPFVVWWRPQDGAQTAEREILSNHAYSVVEFDL